MDFEGQKLSELIFHILIIAFGAVGWVIGYFQQDFTVVFQFWLVGLVLSVIVSHEREQDSCFALLELCQLMFVWIFRLDRFAFPTGHSTTVTPSSGWNRCLQRGRQQNHPKLNTLGRQKI